MSDHTSHRRRARHQRTREARANVTALDLIDRTYYGECRSQCDRCHETGEYIDTVTGKVL